MSDWTKEALDKKFKEYFEMYVQDIETLSRLMKEGGDILNVFYNFLHLEKASSSRVSEFLEGYIEILDAQGLSEIIDEEIPIIGGKYIGEKFLVTDSLRGKFGTTDLFSLLDKGILEVEEALENGYVGSDEPFYYGIINNKSIIIAEKDLGNLPKVAVKREMLN